MLSILNNNQLKEEDFQSLIDQKVPENQALEYKLIYDFRDNKDKASSEFLKDVTGMANASGGYLIIGIEEEDNIPVRLVGAKYSNVIEEISRFKKILLSNIEPRITGIEIIPVDLKNGEQLICVYIPRSWNLPHRVKRGKTSKFYLRHNEVVNETSVEELRALFTQDIEIEEKVEAFIVNRINKFLKFLVPQLHKADGVLVVHLVPFLSFQRSYNVNLKTVQMDVGKFDLFQTASSSGFNLDGFGFFQSGEYGGFSQVFRNGILEGAKTNLISKGSEKIIPAEQLRADIHQAFNRGMEGLRLLNVSPPILVSASLLFVAGSNIQLASDLNLRFLPSAFREEVVRLPSVVINSFDGKESNTKELDPIIDVIWNAAGKSGQ